MREELLRFIETPDRETFLAFRAKIIASAAYQPYSDEFDTVGELLEKQKFQEAQEILRQAMGNLMLSPRAHQLLGFLHHKLGDEQRANMEMMIGIVCVEGILTTGDGSQESPYLVLRTSDEYDVLEHFEKQLQQQSLLHRDDRHFDRIECTDGTTYWFDITDAYNQLGKSIGA
jgi:hypothetical protein